MLLSLILQTFLLTSFQPNSGGHASSMPMVVSASVPLQPQYETIEAVDEVTGQRFAHTLPRVEDTGFGPKRLDPDSLGILTSASSALVLDRRTSQILFAKEAERVRPIASMTKLMTVYTLMREGIAFDETLTIQPSDFRLGGRINLFTGETFLVQDVWMAALIASDNLAIAALVRHAGYDEPEFVEKMNQYAKELGMTHSRFVEPTGIDRGNVSTASDLAKILDITMQIPEIADALRRPVYTFKPVNKDVERKVINTNELLGSFVDTGAQTILGGKTGFTYEAGYCLGVVADGPQNNDEIIVVALGADTIDQRFLDVKGLIEWAYRTYQWQ